MQKINDFFHPKTKSLVNETQSLPVTQTTWPSESIKITTPYKDPYSLKQLSMTDTEKVEFLTAKWEPFDVSVYISITKHISLVCFYFEMNVVTENRN